MKYWERIECSGRGILSKQHRRCPGRIQRILLINVIWTQNLSWQGCALVGATKGAPPVPVPYSFWGWRGAQRSAVVVAHCGYLPEGQSERQNEQKGKKKQRAICPNLPSFRVSWDLASLWSLLTQGSCLSCLMVFYTTWCAGSWDGSMYVLWQVFCASAFTSVAEGSG